MSNDLRSLSIPFERPPRAVIEGLALLSPNELADALDLAFVMRREVHPLWPDMPRIAGPAFTVRTGRHDNLMAHAAVYLASPGDVIVVEAGDDEMAIAGGNVCAIAQRRGVVALVVDGVVRDVPESAARKFPLLARGVSPIPAKRVGEGSVCAQIRCGGVVVNPGDVIVGDHEGVVVIPKARAGGVLEKARAKADAEAKMSLDEWQDRHRANVEAALSGRGYKLD